MANETWTFITDRLPDPTGSYWVTTVGGSVHLGFMKPDGSGFRRQDVVAWLPCPPTPEPARFAIVALQSDLVSPDRHSNSETVKGDEIVNDQAASMA